MAEFLFRLLPNKNAALLVSPSCSLRASVQIELEFPSWRQTNGTLPDIQLFKSELFPAHIISSTLGTPGSALLGACRNTVAAALQEELSKPTTTRLCPTRYVLG